MRTRHHQLGTRVVKQVCMAIGDAKCRHFRPSSGARRIKSIMRFAFSEEDATAMRSPSARTFLMKRIASGKNSKFTGPDQLQEPLLFLPSISGSYALSVCPATFAW
jgi:hypothetical protein